jgi:hypothetical protein
MRMTVRTQKSDDEGKKEQKEVQTEKKILVAKPGFKIEGA